ncbi:hypothetical protein BY458DRAFT_515983 [Sporodiniella umbellata]|nr:hypothetical protein BY458DRAFT_515983 [Sporodiniella umbellata]
MVYFDGGSGKLTDENGNEVIKYQMEVDIEEHLLTSTITLFSYLDLKPVEKCGIPMNRVLLRTVVRNGDTKIETRF